MDAGDFIKEARTICRERAFEEAQIGATLAIAQAILDVGADVLARLDALSSEVRALNG